MTWGYHHFWKHPHIPSPLFSGTFPRYCNFCVNFVATEKFNGLAARPPSTARGETTKTTALAASQRSSWAKYRPTDFTFGEGGGIIMVENLELWGSPNFRTLACTPKSIKGQKCVGISLFLDPFHQAFLALCTHQDFRKQVYLHFLNPIKPFLLKSEWKQKRYSLPTASSLNFTNSTASLYLFSSWWFQPISKTLFKLGSFPQIGMKILMKKMKPPPSFLLTKKKWGPTTLQTVAPSVKVAPGKPVFGPWEVGVLPFRNLENRPYQGTTSKTLGHVWDVFYCEVCNPITRIFF